MRAERFRGAEAAGVVDRGDVCEGGHRPDAGDRHQAPTDVRVPGRRGQGSIQRLPFCAHTLSNPQQRLDGCRQFRQCGHFKQLDHAGSKAIAVDFPDF